MFISTKVTIDISTGKVLHREGYEYTGPLAECKGDQVLRDQEKSQAAFTKSLQTAFQTQFAQQQELLHGFLNPKLEAMITNPQGYSPEALAAMKTGAINDTATQYQNALKATQARTAGQGGPTGLPSGVQAQVQGQLAAAGAGTEVNALQQIELQNENLKQGNKWRAISALSGSAQLADPMGYAQTANQGSGVVSNLGTAYNATEQNSFWSKLGNSFADTLGSTLAGGKTGVKSLYGG